MKVLWEFIKFCRMMVGNTFAAACAVLYVRSIVVALLVILDNHIPEDLWKRKDG